MKIYASWFDKLLESIFCILLVVEVFSLQKVFEMLEEVVVSWQEVRWILQKYIENPATEESGGLQSIGLQRVGHD